MSIKKIVIPSKMDLDTFISSCLLKYLYPDAEIEYYQNKDIPKEYIENPEIALINLGNNLDIKLNNFSLPNTTQKIVIKFFKDINSSIKEYPYLLTLLGILELERITSSIKNKNFDVYEIILSFNKSDKVKLDYILSLTPSYEIGKIIFELISFKKQKTIDVFNPFKAFKYFVDFVEKLYNRIRHEL